MTQGMETDRTGGHVREGTGLSRMGLNEILVGGRKIAYRLAGRGRPVVLLHGGAEDGRAWRLQREGLADEFEVIAWDAPGCGASSDVPEAWRMPDYADALAGFLRALGVERPHLVGLSWGSTLALEFDRRHPGVAASLVLAGAYAGWGGSLPPGEVEARLRDVLAAAGLPRDRALEGLPGMLEGPVPQELATEMAQVWADNMGGRLPGGYRAMAHAMAEADLRPALPLIAVPTLLLHGEKDRRAPVAVAHELRARIPMSRLVVIAGVGHLVNLEAPQEFNAQVRRFLRSVHGSATSP